MLSDKLKTLSTTIKRQLFSALRLLSALLLSPVSSFHVHLKKEKKSHTQREDSNKTESDAPNKSGKSPTKRENENSEKRSLDVELDFTTPKKDSRISYSRVVKQDLLKAKGGKENDSNK